MKNKNLSKFRSYDSSFLLFLFLFDPLPCDPTCICLMQILATINTMRIMIAPTLLSLKFFFPHPLSLPLSYPPNEICSNPRLPNVGVEL